MCASVKGGEKEHVDMTGPHVYRLARSSIG